MLVPRPVTVGIYENPRSFEAKPPRRFGFIVKDKTKFGLILEKIIKYLNRIKKFEKKLVECLFNLILIILRFAKLSGSIS
jgi:hypothetical protein